MAQEEYDYLGNALSEFNTKIRDLEEKQRIMKDRVLLIGQNLIEIREKNNQDLLELKKDVEILKIELKRVKDFLDNALGELSKFAKKSELAILVKQAKMFQPLERMEREEIRRIIKEELKNKQI